MACCQEFAVIDCHVATLLAMTMLVIRWLLATQGKRAKSLRRGGKSAEMKAAGYEMQENGLGSVCRERESRQLPFSPALRMAAREEGFTEYFVNLVV